MKTRTGKIARLPKDIRDQLNQQIEDGIIGHAVLSWLNALPEVQKILAEHFGGRPVSHQNLSEWRHGAYAEWAATRDGRAQWQEMLENARTLSQKRTGEDGQDVSRYLGSFLIFELGEAMNDLRRMKNLDERWRILSMVSRALSRLRTDDCREKRLQLRNLQAAKRNGRIKAIPSESNLKKFSSQFSQPLNNASATCGTPDSSAATDAPPKPGNP